MLPRLVTLLKVTLTTIVSVFALLCNLCVAAALLICSVSNHNIVPHSIANGAGAHQAERSRSGGSGQKNSGPDGEVQPTGAKLVMPLEKLRMLGRNKIQMHNL